MDQGVQISRITNEVFGVKIVVGNESAGIHTDRAGLENMRAAIDNALASTFNAEVGPIRLKRKTHQPA